MEEAELYEFEILKQQAEQIQQHRQLYEQELNEIRAVLDSLVDLEKGKETDIIFPLGAGILTKAKIKNTGTLLVSVSSDIVLEKDIKDIKKDLLKKMEESKNIITELDKNLLEIDERAKKIAEKLEKSQHK